MRLFFSLLVIAAAAYLGYVVFSEKSTPKADDATSPATTEPAAAVERVEPFVPIPGFKSKIVIPPGAPGEKHLAPPGVFYMLDRVSIEHATGIAAVVPGEPVKLMMRKAGGVLKVTSGKYEFEVKESQVTNDLEVAQEAERKFVLAPPLIR